MTLSCVKYPAVAVALVGRERMAASVSLVSLFGTVFTASMPFIGGLLRDAFGTWRVAFSFACLLLLISLLCATYTAVAIARGRTLAAAAALTPASNIRNQVQAAEVQREEAFGRCTLHGKGTSSL